MSKIGLLERATSAESHLPAEKVASTEFCAAWSGKNRLFSFKAAPSKMKVRCVEKVCVKKWSTVALAAIMG